MKADKREFTGVGQAEAAIEAIGSTNADMMALRAVHVNVLVRDVPGPIARTMKQTYNDIGAEAAISHDAYYDNTDAPTDMLVMGTIYQHREARRILADQQALQEILSAIELVAESPETDIR